MADILGVLFAAFEAVPFMKTGGLGDVAGSLPAALKKSGCDVRIVIPKFRNMPEEYKRRMTHVTDFYVPLGWRNEYCGIETLDYNGVTCYFIDNESYFDRDGAYGHFDDGERIAFFSKAIVECIQYLPNFKCDILHCNDWHTALAPVFLREFYMGMPVYQNIKTVFTVHNLKFQGQFTDLLLGDMLGLSHITPAADQLRCDSRSINYMKGALCYSDLLSTVSPTYAGEIQNSYFGEHMDDIFRRRSHVLYGILNGIDTDVYNPQKDNNIAAKFSRENLEGKKKCKAAIQRELGLWENPDMPLIIMIGRLTEQKGMDLVRTVLGELMNEGVQMAVLGTGDRQYEDMFHYFEGIYPGKLAVRTMFDEMLSHRMYAGADMLLMPSKFEPCGLSQMIAMAYGTLPIVREIGGLKDSVKPYNMYTGEGTGFSFCNYNAHEMLFTVKYAIGQYYNNKDDWKRLQKNAMSEDFGWMPAAGKYIEMYMRLHPEAGLMPQSSENGEEGSDSDSGESDQKKNTPVEKKSEPKKRGRKPGTKNSTSSKASDKAAEQKAAPKKRGRKPAAQKAAESVKDAGEPAGSRAKVDKADSDKPAPKKRGRKPASEKAGVSTTVKNTAVEEYAVTKTSDAKEGESKNTEAAAGAKKAAEAGSTAKKAAEAGSTAKSAAEAGSTAKKAAEKEDAEKTAATAKKAATDSTKVDNKAAKTRSAGK